MSRLANSSAIVTGASSGIGRATALALAAKGARLALLARSANDLKKVVQEAEALGSPETFSMSVDVRDEGAVNEFIAATLDRYTQIDVLINSAGLSINGEVDGYNLADWQTVIETNLTGTFLTCRAVLPTMKRQRSGQIINISSGAGKNGIKNMSAYCASKFGVIGFTEALSLEVRNHNIRVSTLAPGSVTTGFGQRSRGGNRGEEHSQGSYAMTADEVAAVILAMLEQPDQAWMSEVTLRPLNLELRRHSE